MKQVISIALAFLLLLSSSGLTYAQHYCGDHKMMAKVTLGETRLSCGMEMMNSACGDESMDEHDCCDNEYTSINTDDNYSMASMDLQLNTSFVVAFVSVFVMPLVDNYEQNLDFYKDYSPPPLGEDLQVLYETFLI